jgi:hypothetical protein
MPIKQKFQVNFIKIFIGLAGDATYKFSREHIKLLLSG